MAFDIDDWVKLKFPSDPKEGWRGVVAAVTSGGDDDEDNDLVTVAWICDCEIDGEGECVNCVAIDEENKTFLAKFLESWSPCAMALALLPERDGD